MTRRRDDTAGDAVGDNGGDATVVLSRTIRRSWHVNARVAGWNTATQRDVIVSGVLRLGHQQHVEFLLSDRADNGCRLVADGTRIKQSVTYSATTISGLFTVEFPAFTKPARQPEI